MKVECIIDFAEWARDRAHKKETYPTKGQIYHVREKTNFGGIIGYRLVEIVNPEVQHSDSYGECSFVASGFRPVTDISVLTKLTKVRELEDA